MQASPPLGREHQQLCVGVLWLCRTENSHTVIPKSFGFQADGKLTPATEGVWPPAPNPCGKKSVKGGRCRSWFPPAPTTLMGQKATWCCCCQQSFSVEHQRLWNLLTIVTGETVFVLTHDTMALGCLRRIWLFLVDFFVFGFLHSLAQEKIVPSLLAKPVANRKCWQMGEAHASHEWVELAAGGGARVWFFFLFEVFLSLRPSSKVWNQP